jgi:hypothetical protein
MPDEAPVKPKDGEKIEQYPREGDTLEHISLRELKLRNR